jgi:hypothetical protein
MIQPTNDALFSFLTDTVASIDGVRSWQASMELLTIRRGFVETPWWRSEMGHYLRDHSKETGAPAASENGGASGGSSRRL